jgi:chemotaxis protein MotB
MNPNTHDTMPHEAENATGGSALIMNRVRKLQKDLEKAQAELKALSHKKKAGKRWHFTPEASEEEHEEGWLTTYLDMMTLLLVLLVVMLAFSGNGIVDNIKQRTGNTLPAGAGLLPEQDSLPSPAPLPGEAARSLLEGLPIDQLGQDIDVIVNDRSVSFRINSEILFSSGQADLSLEGLAVLRRLIPVLKGGSQIVTVEGHTDSIPIRSARYPSNWELSGSRAGSVVRYLEANGIDSRRLKAVGYADTRPLVDNSTAEGRANNRRVELMLEAEAPK